MPSIEVVARLLLNGISASLVLALAALGLAVIFGFMDIINLTHGVLITVGGYTMWIVNTVFGVSFWLGLIIAAIAAGIVGLATEIAIVHRLYGRLLDTLLATWALALGLREVIKIAAGGTTAKPVSNPLPARIDLVVTTYPAYRLFLIALGVVTIVAVFVLFNYTNFGVRLRAVLQNETAAELLGLSETRINRFAYFLGSALAGLAGGALAPIASVTPTMGQSYLIKSFFAVIVGGTGFLLGVVPGSVLIAGASNLMTFSISPVVADTLVFVFAIVVLAVRPRAVVAFDNWRTSFRNWRETT